MNLLSPGITETDNGDILVVWGGRRIVTRMLVPPLIEGQELEMMGIPVERVWRRRYRWDSGPLVLTKVYDGGKKRQDYNAVGFGRNPAITKDKTGRLWLGYRIPIISSQDPFGALSSEYVTPQNIGTTAGMNFWQMVRADDVTKFRGAWPWSGAAWQEQVEMKAPPVVPVGEVSPDLSALSLDELIDYLQQLSGGIAGSFTDEGGDGWNMFSDFTVDRLSGKLMFRGQGGNEMDEKEIKRWKWNEAEGLGRTWSACEMLSSGAQARLRGRVIEIALAKAWTAGEIVNKVTKGDYGISGNLRLDSFDQIWVAGYNATGGEIPYQVENEQAVQTSRPADPGEEPAADSTPLAHSVWQAMKDNYDAWLAKQVEYSAAWAEDNERDWIFANAGVPGEGYGKEETQPTEEEKAKETNRQIGYYYALPTLSQERVGFCVSRTGLQYLAWVHGNLSAVPKEGGKYKAVGLRMAISRDGGRTFEPLIPERIGYLNHAGGEN